MPLPSRVNVVHVATGVAGKTPSTDDGGCVLFHMAKYKTFSRSNISNVNISKKGESQPNMLRYDFYTG